MVDRFEVHYIFLVGKDMLRQLRVFLASDMRLLQVQERGTC